MQSLKFKDKVKKKVKEFLAVTLISSSLMVSCGPKGNDNIYDNHTDFDFTSTTDTDKDVLNDKDPVNDKDTFQINDNDIEGDLDSISTDNDKENINDKDLDSDEDIIGDLDEDIIDINDEDVDINVDNDSNDEISLPDEDVERLCVNTGTKYIVDCENLRTAYQDDCLDFTVVGKLLAENCDAASEIDLETISGKCYVPYYMTGNAPYQGTNACSAQVLMNTITHYVENGVHESNPQVYEDEVKVINQYLLYSYLAHEYVKNEDIRKVVTYPHDSMGTEYLIDNYLNTFEFGSKTYTMLNEHLNVLHEMEFINTNNNMHKRIRMYPSLLYYLETFPIIPLDLMKCPQEASNEASIAVLGFIANKQLIENDIKYQKFMSGECDAYYIQKGQEFVQQVLGK